MEIRDPKPGVLEVEARCEGGDMQGSEGGDSGGWDEGRRGATECGVGVGCRETGWRGGGAGMAGGKGAAWARVTSGVRTFAPIMPLRNIRSLMKRPDPSSMKGSWCWVPFFAIILKTKFWRLSTCPVGQ